MLRKAMEKVNEKAILVSLKSKHILEDKRGEGFVDSAVKILIAVVIGALLLGGLYALFGDVILPTLTQRIKDMFDFTGTPSVS